MDSLILAKDLQEAFRDYIANGAISLGSLFFLFIGELFILTFFYFFH